jgi:hypothetical protein
MLEPASSILEPAFKEESTCYDSNYHHGKANNNGNRAHILLLRFFVASSSEGQLKILY